jgi:hypothetical protein
VVVVGGGGWVEWVSWDVNRWGMPPRQRDREGRTLVVGLLPAEDVEEHGDELGAVHLEELEDAEERPVQRRLHAVPLVRRDTQGAVNVSWVGGELDWIEGQPHAKPCKWRDIKARVRTHL